ncbi:MAG: lipopolysaccharide biosynthesis protein, partial [Terriglobales bacterium]
LVRVVSLARLASNALIVALVLLTWNFVAPIFHLAAYRADFVLFGPLVLLYFQDRVLEFALASHMLHRYSVGSTVLMSITKLIAYLVLAAGHALSLRSAILSDTVACALAYLFMQIAYARNARPFLAARPRQPPAVERKRIWRYAMYNNFNDAGSLLLYVQTDNFFIAALLNPIAVGAYAFYTRVNSMVSNLTPTRLLENVLLPLFFSVPREEAPARLPRYFSLLLNCGLAVQLPLVAYSIVYHRELVQVLLGGKFLELSWLMPVIIAFGATSNVIAIPVTCVAQYHEKASLILVSQLFGLYQIGCMLLLVPLLGLLGAATATGTYHLFRNAFVWWKVRQDARWLNVTSVAAYSALIWCSAILACFGLKRVMPAPMLLSLVCGGVICVLAMLVHLRSPALSGSDRELLRQLFHGREARLLRRLGVLARPEHA